MSEEARKREDDYYAGTMKDDYISRKAVLDMLDEECGSCADMGYIFSLPGIEAEERKGKWIPHNEKSREYIGTVLINVEYDYWLCDACGYRVENGQPMYNFCPMCGADMRGEDDE